MDLDYDHKFEEMKKYIPFLDNMIRRLESTGSGTSNPRQAQLDKIRSLRDLLQDKRKRMKMENLLKCKQVLINLYTKVEQRDNVSDKSKGTGSQSRKNTELDAVRNKLKCVTMTNAVDAETLPEIARSNEMTEMCTPGSKEPALFQRRPSSSQIPNDSSSIKTRDSTMVSTQSNSRRDYTRVLVSPETSNRRRVSIESTPSNKLFTRRSPKRSSSTYYKKERKKIPKNIDETTKNKDLNITLNVPEDSLNSLNTKDILSRIITCSNDDVDIETLRELRTQILGELKQTGANDDISDLILKSYKTKKSCDKYKEEVEEGELSDSESEAIESIYGSLVVVDKDKSNIVIENTIEKDQSRKIQICLVINSKDDKKCEQTIKEQQKTLDTSDLNLLNENDNKVKKIDEKHCKKADSDNISSNKTQTKEAESMEQNKVIRDKNQENDSNSVLCHNKKQLNTHGNSNKNEKSQKETTITNVDIAQNTIDNKTKTIKDNKLEGNSLHKAYKSHESQNKDGNVPIAFKANFYKPLVNDEASHKDDIVTAEKVNVQLEDSLQCNKSNAGQKSAVSKKGSDLTFGKSKEKDLELPFLNESCISDKNIEKDVVSQIDILQALKNDILNENLDVPGSEVSTPPLHQPKLIKVASAQKIIPNRISIEKYKEKNASLSPLFKNNHKLSSSSKEDSFKKQSIKLTEKECERFKFASNIDFDDVNVSSEGEEDKNSDLVDLYDDLAPKSPDLDDTNDILKAPPIIIPAEPVKAIVVNSKIDVDMRTYVSTDIKTSNFNINLSEERKQEGLINELTFDKNSDNSKLQLLDPRIRRDVIQPASIEQSIVQPSNADRTPRPKSYSNNIIGNMTPNRVPCMASATSTNIPPLMGQIIAPIMTPNHRTYENTPTRQSFDVERNTTNNKHVYAPSFPLFEFPKTTENSISKESNSQWDSEINTGRRNSTWEDSSCNNSYNHDNNKSSLNESYKIDRRENNNRIDCPRTPIPSFGWSDSTNSANVFNKLDAPMTPSNCFGRVDCPSTPSHPFGRSESPLTPSHPFGRLDYPTTPHHLGMVDYPVTPTHPFGRLDCPLTPSHPFGRADCPPTPSHPFGRAECPPTPSHSFGRADCPPTPSHPFGRAECPPTPSHPFGRAECPPTPSNPFGRAECPPTPSHSFGRAECPPTPSHSFGQLDGNVTPSHSFGQLDGSATPSHSFGRTDYSQNTINRQISYKDPRLNKNANYDQGRQSVEREHRYYRDGGFNPGISYNAHKRPYNNNSQSYGRYEREPSIGGNNFNTYYSTEQNASRFYRESRRESSIARNTKDRHIDHRYERDSRYNYDKRSSYRERGYHRERSVGRISSTEENYQSRTRSQSVGKNYQNETNLNKTLSVKSYAGRSFIIDTSVNSTFQDFMEKKEIFDTHRTRASSVGRALIRESSVSRTILPDSKSTTTDYKWSENNKNSRFTRARSLGRDLSNRPTEKSFQDIKADFKRYKSHIDSKLLKNMNDKVKDSKSRFNNKSNSSGSQSKKGIYDIHNRKSSESKVKVQYSPRKNCRDPRIRGEIDKNAKSKNIDQTHRDEKSSGIVYSNDNIAKGAVLGTGFGVKNYKIPKIKRVTSENDEKDLKVNEKSENTKTKQDDVDVNLDKTTTVSSITIEPNKVDQNSTKRITRSSSNISSSKSVDNNTFVKTRKCKNIKPLIYESESDCEDLINEKACEDDNTMLSQEATGKSQNLKPNKNTRKKSELNSVFSLEDLDVFSDNIVSEPVIENINALIADLDNDIDTSKNDLCGNFTKDDTFESMLNIMDNSENVDKTSKESVHDISEGINKELIKENKNGKDEKKVEVNDINESFNAITHETEKPCDESLNVTNIIHENKSLDSNISENREDVSELVLKSTNSEPIVSTTYADVECSKHSEEKNTVTRADDDNLDGCSTPDSTINLNEAINKPDEDGTVPDSTNEQKTDVKSDLTNEFNTDVTSTNTSSDLHVTDNIKPCSSRLIEPALDSIGSLLSILKDKSKIKELVSMLAEKTGENEKIMKKLEKLSEIVSDDDDINDTLESKANDCGETGITDDVTSNLSGPVESVIKESQNEENIIKTNLEDEIKPNTVITSVNTNDGESSNLDTILNVAVTDRNEEKQSLEEDIDTDADSEKANVEEQDKIKLSGDAGTGIYKMPQKVTTKTKRKCIKKAKKKFTKPNKINRITRTTPTNVKTVMNKSKKKPSRELLQLQEDIKEMFLNGEILQTGIRMCRLAKMVDEKQTQKEDMPVQDPKPVVVLKKCKEMEKRDSTSIDKPTRKKPGPKSKSKDMDNNVNVESDNKVKKTNAKNKIPPKNKSKNTQKHMNVDPYAFESDSVDTFTLNESRDEAENSTDSESPSLNSSRSFGSNELLAELTKNPKRKRRNPAWQSGIIRTKNKKKKLRANSTKDNEMLIDQPDVVIPDMECFTDKSYCFDKNVSNYSCRLCVYSGSKIVHHYKQQHPHVEIPLSRMNPTTAREAIEQCKKTNFEIIGKIPSDKYVCRFCYKEFSKGRNVMESFFWHIVSVHTGEYKHSCSECEEASDCSLNLDIPPPPKDMKGQLIGYICKKCNFTQISIENLKRHVIVRHNDEKTEVYKINLASMPKKLLNSLANEDTPESHRVTRSSVSNRFTDDVANDHSDHSDHTDNEISSVSGLQHDDSPEWQTLNKPEISSKITFETDNGINRQSNSADNKLIANVKQEKENNFIETEGVQSNFENDAEAELSTQKNSSEVDNSEISTHINDIVACVHFKITYQSSGTKEYICCINGHDNHYQTSLLISMKKHIQTKHTELWDGYCFICKVIVTSQGSHSFKDCLQHMLDKHMDEYPLLDNSTVTANSQADIEDALPKSYINVRPLAQLITNNDAPVDTPGSSYPKIDSIGTVNMEPTHSSPNYPIVKKPMQPEKQYKYEEWQVEVISKKHRVVLETMMSRDKLVQVYKCAGRFCSFTTDNAEGALLHASTHQRIGGVNALLCAYCDFDTTGNAIDLVMHVFKAHGHCQYSCALCFYRAAARQLVGAHVERKHKEKPSSGSVLRTKTLSVAVTEDSTNLLSREDAVEYYYCAHGLDGNNPNARCVHKSYLPDKFVEHLENKHAAPHPCTMCTYKSSSAKDLIEHMKSHNMNAYQCTWCVYGADNEQELMMHASIYHPTKHPNAYVRAITSKENSSELRVLPMASFNKINTPVEDVTSNVTDDPIREAERSLDLEKLIGDIEKVSTGALVQSDTQIEKPENLTENSVLQQPKQNELKIVDNSTTCSTFPDMIETLVRKNNNQVNKEDSIVKSEPEEQKSILDSAEIIYCSDSDDDESRQSTAVIDLSNDDPVVESPVTPVETYRKVSTDQLNKCPKCTVVYRTIVGFKKHIIACWAGAIAKSYKCAHYPCNKMLSNVNGVVKHYIKDHKDSNEPSYFCGICNSSLVSLQKAKHHLKYVHKIDNCSVQTTTAQSGKIIYTMFKGKDTPSRKRKSSSETSKQRRYGPQEVDKLPITPILDDFVYCSLCEFNTKVRLNMVRHLQLHAQQQPVPHTAPVNPVPHLETNEKHFDKMLNLASSSFTTRGFDKHRSDTSTSVSLVPPETASRYPKYVPERQRYTCGSKGCAYISLSEDMFQCHWETLHSNTNEYHCVHCPRNQQLDTTKPLTASLIIGHLKMHDTMLYACPSCPYYHYKRQIVEVHMTNIHGGGQIVIVREDSSTAGPAPAPVTSAPTMDLKPWQCGLCKFKSMLRPEVTEHCSKVHQSKMQYKCTYCPFRTSTLENVTKHQTNSHPDKDQNVFYYYYREGSVPDDEDNTPLWMKQKQKTNPSGPEVKTEEPDTSIQVTPVLSVTPSVSAVSVDLNIVKQEINDVDMDSVKELSVTDLCRKYGQFCEPNGIMYKCPLCNIVVESDRQTMQSHLYEELKYRRYSCGICSYKAFHSSGLKEHMTWEHNNRMHQEPIKLPKNLNIEKWVTKQLDYQTNLIEIREKIIANQKLTVTKVTAGPSQQLSSDVPPPEDPELSVAELENAFGEFGTPSDMQYRCPKCNFSDKDEHAMREHLENELAKIRWGCNICKNHYQTYHQAQFHCKSVHTGQSARPTEAIRDPHVRASWVAGVIKSQKLLIDIPAFKQIDGEDNFLDNGDNSLLIVRYEERVPTPEETMRRKRLTPESDDEISDEEGQKKKSQKISCQYCNYTTKYKKSLTDHTYRHYDLKPYICPVCSLTGYWLTITKHIEKLHPGMSVTMKRVPLPKEPPKNLILEKRKATRQLPTQAGVYMVCLHCEKSVAENEIETHRHENRTPEFAKKGEVVVKCCICLALRLDVKSLQEHHNSNHPDIPINYSFFKMQCESRDIHHCGYCKSHFRYLRDLKTHHNALHNPLQLTYTTSASLPGTSSQEEVKSEGNDDELISAPGIKRVAKKSTTKLPMFKTVAKKSTTKLPVMVYSDDSDTELLYPESCYGRKPSSLENYADVTALMPFCGTIMRFTMDKLTEIIPIEPKVLIKDLKSDSSERNK